MSFSLQRGGPSSYRSGLRPSLHFIPFLHSFSFRVRSHTRRPPRTLSGSSLGGTYLFTFPVYTSVAFVVLHDSSSPCVTNRSSLPPESYHYISYFVGTKRLPCIGLVVGFGLALVQSSSFWSPPRGVLQNCVKRARNFNQTPSNSS